MSNVPSVTSTVVFNPNHCVLGIKNHCYKLTVLLLYIPCNFSEKTLFVLIVISSSFLNSLKTFYKGKITSIKKKIQQTVKSFIRFLVNCTEWRRSKKKRRCRSIITIVNKVIYLPFITQDKTSYKTGLLFCQDSLYGFTVTVLYSPHTLYNQPATIHIYTSGVVNVIRRVPPQGFWYTHFMAYF